MNDQLSRIECIDGAPDAQVVNWLAARLGEALNRAQGGEIAIAVPGGSTPFPILASLATRDLAWNRIAVWPGDDRIVPEDNPASNAGRIRALLEPARARIVPLTEQARPPHFALVWLGMGTDGHIASLFPSSDPRVDDPALVRRIVPDPLPPEAPYARLSLTIPALLNTDRLLFVVRGEAKRDLFDAAVRAEHDLPVARLLAARRQPVTCFA